MTQPLPSAQDESNALGSVTQMLTGTKMLQDQPGVVYSLMQAKAQPQMAGAIDQFMQGLSAEKQVNLARATNHPIVLSQSQQDQLKSLNVPYQDVLFTQADQATATAKLIEQKSGGSLTAKLNSDGTLATDAAGNVISISTHGGNAQKTANGLGLAYDTSGDNKYKAKGIGRLFQTLHNDIIAPAERDVIDPTLHTISPVTNALTKGWNVANTVVGDVGSGLSKVANDLGISNDPNPTTAYSHKGNLGQDINSIAGASPNEDAQMKAAGYDPGNPFSILAYDASGQAKTDTSDLVDQYGQDKVDQATQFLNSPTSYVKSIEANTNLTPQQVADQISAVSSPEFTSLTRQLASRTAGIGNDTAHALGLDPVKHPDTYATVSAVANLAGSFIIDPTMALGKAVQVTRLGQVGLDTVADAERVAASLDPAGMAAKAAATGDTSLAGAVGQVKQGVFLNNTQRRAQNFLDLTHAQAAAAETGDVRQAASLDAQITTQFPELSPLRADVLGKDQILRWEETKDPITGVLTANPVTGKGAPITNLAELADYISSQSATLRLAGSKAAVSSPYMPGAVSGMGARLIRGKMSGWLAGRAAVRNAENATKVTDRLAADPAIADKWVTEGLASQISAKGDDAVDSLTGAALADHTAIVQADMALLQTTAQNILEHANTDLGLRSKLDDMEQRFNALSDQFEHGDASASEVADAEEAVKEAHALLAAHVATDPELAADAEAAGGLTGAMPSQARAKAYALTPAGRGQVAYNLRKTGSPLGNGGRIVGWAMPSAVAERARLAATRLTNLLPRNTQFDLADASTADKIYSYTRLYANHADASQLRAQYIVGDGAQRKAVITGMLDQIAHSAGLASTESGRNLMKSWRTVDESYNTAGDSLLDETGRPIALHVGQVNTVWNLPSFQELHQAANKLGLWEATLGRALTTDQASLMMSSVKMGWLFRPATVTRNQLEAYLRTGLEGGFGDAIKARAFATARNKELWDRGIGVEDLDKFRASRLQTETLQRLIKEGTTDETGKVVPLAKSQIADANTQLAHEEQVQATLRPKPIVAHALALEAGNTSLATAIKNSSMLTGEILGRSSLSTRLADFMPFALAGRAYRHMTGVYMDDARLKALATMGPQELSEGMEGFARQMFGDLGVKRAANEAAAVTEAGWGPARLAHAFQRAKDRKPGERVSVSWTQHDLDGTVGADRYANALAQRVNPSPQVARAVIDHLNDPENVNLDGIVAALDSKEMAQSAHLIGWGSRFWPNEAGKAVPAHTADEIAMGKQQQAADIVKDYKKLLTGQNGKYQQDLADHIYENGKAPSSDWIVNNLKRDNLPDSALAPEVTPLANGGALGAAEALMDVTGAGYQWMVERLLQRTTTSPVFLANYADARVGLNAAVDRMVERGLSQTAAENMAKELSIRQAWIKTERLVDDPGQKAQFDIITRNIFPFARATQAMIRRWGGGLWQDPLKARKMMLAYEGSVQSGFVYTNTYGEPTFVYPGSGVMNMALRELAKVPGFESIARFPVSASMTGGVLMAVPGANDPLRMSAGPMVMIPLREVEKILPGNAQIIFDQIDRALNGPVGQGETFSQLEPSPVNKFFANLSEGDRNTALASSMMGAYANLAASGLVPAPDAPDNVRQAFLNNLRTQVHNQLFLRAVFGLIAPASPSQPLEDTPQTHSDFAFQERGVHNLDDEYKTILNDVDGDLARANAIFTALHPDKVVFNSDGSYESYAPASSAFETAQTQMAAAKVSLPPTTAALKWMTNHSDFISKYGSVAAYFLPQPTTQQPFNDQAYRMQIELGLRQRKTPEGFMNDVTVRNAEAIYYPAVDKLDAQIAQAKAAGNTVLAQQITAAKSQWETDFKAQNAAFGSKIDSFPDSRATAKAELNNLRDMLAKNQVPDGLAPLLGNLVKSYDTYAAFQASHKGQDQTSIQARSAALGAFNGWVTQNISGTPLMDLYNGVLRALNTNLVNLTPFGSGS